MLCLFVLMSCASPAADSQKQSFAISSPDFKNGESLSKHNESASSARGCHGDNVSPTLQWTGVPDGTMSFALTMYDVDANHTHWIVFNIPGNQNELHDHPPYSQGINNAQQVGYNGPCPTPDGKIHHYVFTLYALSVATIQGDKTLTYEQLLGKIAHNEQGKTSIVGTFSRTSNT
jgi:Raf kinase inhibitor-like YbhB/YbcL family protein